MKIGVIGFGQATIGFLHGIMNDQNNKMEIYVFEKQPEISKTSLSGIRQDGKLFVSSEMGGDHPKIQNNIGLQKYFIDFLLQFLPDASRGKENILKTKIEELELQQVRKRFFKEGFILQNQIFYHIGTDLLPILLKNIFEYFSKNYNINFLFDSEIESVIQTSDNKFQLKQKNGKIYDKFDKVIIGVGRSGVHLIQNLVKQDLIKNNIQANTNVDIGIRYEVPNFVVSDLNEKLYEFKLKYKTQNGLIVRTFCNNPQGFVITEEYSDFTTVNGHQKKFEKSDNTNFQILVTHTFIEPFKDPNQYGINQAKQQNILAGDPKKVLLQTLKDFIDGKRTKKIFQVIPTLPEEKFTLGDINLVLSRKTCNQLIEFITKLGNIIEGINNPYNLIYAVEVKFYSIKFNNQNNIYFIGDCSGWTRSIIYAMCHGYITQKEVIKCQSSE